MKISSLFKLFCNIKISPPNTQNFRQAKVYKQDKLKRLARKSRKTLKNPQGNMRGLTLSDTKTYYKATVINTVWYWVKSKYTNEMEWRIQKYNQILHKSVVYKNLLHKNVVGDKYGFAY